MAIFSPSFMVLPTNTVFYSTMLAFWHTMLLCGEQLNIELFIFLFSLLVINTACHADCMPSKPSLTCFMVFP